MIFRRALLREMAGNALLVFSVLLMITLTTMLIRYLGQAAGGAVANEAVAAFLGFSIINYLPVLLSLTLFIAVLMTLTRCYRDSEMVVWFTAGLSVMAWVRPVMAFAAPAEIDPPLDCMMRSRPPPSRASTPPSGQIASISRAAGRTVRSWMTTRWWC